MASAKTTTTSGTAGTWVMSGASSFTSAQVTVIPIATAVTIALDVPDIGIAATTTNTCAIPANTPVDFFGSDPSRMAFKSTGTSVAVSMIFGGSP